MSSAALAKHAGATGIAAVSGSVPDLVHLALSHESIMCGDPLPALAKLRGLTSDRATSLRMRGRLMLTTGGYDDESRLLCAVPAFQRYAATLLAQWPYLAWFITLREDLAEVFASPRSAPVDASAAAQLADDTFIAWVVSAGVTPTPKTETSLRPHPLDRGTVEICDRPAVQARLKLLLDAIIALGEQHQLPSHVVSHRIWTITRTLERAGLLAPAQATEDSENDQ